MFARFFRIAGLCLLPISVAMAAPGDRPVEHHAASGAGILQLVNAVDVALQDNPGLAAMRARAAAAAAVPEQAAVLPDPRLQLNAVNLPMDTFSLSQEGMTQLQVAVVQALPFPGKLALRERAAEFESAAAHDEVGEMRLQLERDVRSLWWNLYYLDRALEILQRNRQLLRQLVEVAQTKYRVGQGLQQDVLLAQLELSRLHDQEIALLGSRRSEEARLNALLNRPASQPIRLPDMVPATLLEPADEQRLQAQALQNRPLLAARQNVIEAARSRLDLARKERSPDFSLGARYGRRVGDNPDGSARADFASIMFSMNMPIFTRQRQDSAIDQRGSQLQQQRYNLDEARLRVSREVSRVLADYRAAREQARLLKTGILPQARQTVASMLAAYQVDKVDFLNVVRVQIMLFNYETRYWNAISRANQAQAALQAAVGLSFDDHVAAVPLSSRIESDVLPEEAPHE
ncbi:MAG TPA: TolC family protein [Gammaproteobacteria bacterium]|nr:TolC family protein [Gammaproteobacteria bacterium]